VEASITQSGAGTPFMKMAGRQYRAEVRPRMKSLHSPCSYRTLVRLTVLKKSIKRSVERRRISG
jgi:RNase P protein component